MPPYLALQLAVAVVEVEEARLHELGAGAADHSHIALRIGVEGGDFGYVLCVAELPGLARAQGLCFWC